MLPEDAHARGRQAVVQLSGALEAARDQDWELAHERAQDALEMLREAANDE